MVATFRKLLPGAVETVRARMDEMAGLVDIEDDRPVPAIEWQITVDRAGVSREERSR